jgi:hypothetical protein
MDFLYGKATIRLKTLFECEHCPSEQAGDTVTIEVSEFTDASELADEIKNTPNRAQNMPVGWSSYGGPKRDYYLCPKCKEESK